MKKLLTIIGLAVATLSGASAQSIWTNPITGTNPNTSNPYTTGDDFVSNITVSGIGRGSGINGASANNRYNANAWSTGAIDLNDYFSFTITPDAGFRVDFTSFVYTGQVSSGTPSVSFRSSTDSFGSSIGTATVTGTTISLSGSPFQNITSAIEFRFYAFNLATSGTTFSINDFTFNGNVTSTTPTTWTGTGTGGTWQNGETGKFSGNYSNSSTNTVTFLGTAETVTTNGTVEAGSLTFSTANYVLNGAVTLGVGNVTATGLATVNAVLSGAAGLTKSGSSDLILRGTNDYSGTTSITAGVLMIQNGSALGATGAGNGTSVTAGAVLEVEGWPGGITSAEALSLNGTGISNGGALRNLGGNNTMSGAITLGSATRINSDADSLTLSGGISGAFGLTVGGSGDTDISGVIGTGVGTLTKDGSGTVSLTGAGSNTFTGNTSVTAGTLQLNKSGATAIAGNLTVSGGSVSLLSSDNIADSSNVTVSGGALNIAGNSDTVGSVALSAGSISGTSGVLTATSGYTVTNAAGQTTISANIGGSTFAKSGAGDVLVSGDNSFTGATTITAGTLTAASANALGTTAAGTSVSTGAALQLQGGITTSAEALSLSGTGVSNGGALRNLSGNNAYSGAITAATATRINSDSGTLTIDVASGNAITGTNVGVSFGGAGDVAVADAVNIGAGAITKDGAGALTLSAANTYSGGTTISAGTVNAGSTGSLGSGAVTMSAGSLVGADGVTTSNAITIGTAASTATNPFTVAWNFGTASGNASPSSSDAVGFTIGSVTSGNSFGASTLLSSTSASSGYTGASGQQNAGVAANIGTLDTASSTNAYFEYTITRTTATSVSVNDLSFGSRSTSTGPQAYAIFTTGNLSSSLATGSLSNNGVWALLSPSLTDIAVSSGGGTTFRIYGHNGTGSPTSGQTNWRIDDLTLTGNSTTNVAASGTGTVGISGAGNTTFSGNVTINNTATLTAAASGTATFSGAVGGNGSITKTGDGTVVLSGGNSYTGTTLVSAGTLLIEGSQSGTGSVTVQNGATLGGDGSIEGSLILASGANFVFSLTKTLTVNGASVTFGGLSIANITGLDSSVAAGTYTLINGSASFNFANVTNVGASNAFDLGSGKSAYFQNGSLDVVVIPEPQTWALIGLGSAFMLWNLRRKRSIKA